jgi:uncharacterized protein
MVMNNDITTMIELQKYWDAVMSARAVIDKIMTSLKSGEKLLAAKRTSLDALGSTIKELKTSLKQHELDLADMSGRIKKLEERKRIVQTERELKAIDKEIDVLKFDMTTLEDETLSLIDLLDQKQKDYTIMDKDVGMEEEKLIKEKPQWDAELARCEEIVKSNENTFNVLTPKLSTAHRSKFLKIIGSKDAKAIARVEGEICGFCNRKIPASLAIDASRDDKIVNCSNCGKYIYR